LGLEGGGNPKARGNGIGIRVQNLAEYSFGLGRLLGDDQGLAPGELQHGGRCAGLLGCAQDRQRILCLVLLLQKRCKLQGGGQEFGIALDGVAIPLLCGG